MKRMWYLSNFNILLLLAILLGVAGTSDLRFLCLMPLIWIISGYLFLQKCPKCHHRWMMRAKPEGFQAKNYVIAPQQCSNCGFPLYDPDLKLGMRKWYKYASVVLLVAFLVCITIAVPFGTRRSVLKNVDFTISEFQNCWSPSHYRDCAYATSEMRSISPEIFFLNSSKIDSTLGKRISGELLKDKFLHHRSASLLGKSRVDQIEVEVRAIYEKDMFVIERYRLFYNKEIDRYQVDSFQVISQLLR